MLRSSVIEGVVRNFSPARGMGAILGDNGRVVNFASSVVTPLAPALRPGDRVQATVVARGDRLNATSVTRTLAAGWDDDGVRLLLIGRTGVGKSSTVNTLLGVQHAPVGHFRRETVEVHEYEMTIRGSKVTVFDTPGLSDARRDHENDARYVDEIKRHVGRVDLMLFVTQLNETRVRRDELECLDLITGSFGASIWDHTVIVMTHADRVPRKAYTEQLAGRSAELVAEIEFIAPKRGAATPIVAISNRRQRTPDGKRWLGPLWLRCLERMAEPGFESFFLSTVSRLKAEPDVKPEPRGTGSRNGKERPAGSKAKPPTRASAPITKRTVSPPTASARPAAQRPAITRETAPRSEIKAVVAQPKARPTDPPKALQRHPVQRTPADIVEVLDATPEILSFEAVTTTRVREHTSNGVRFVQNNLTIHGDVRGNIILNEGEIGLAGAIASNKAPGLFKKLATAASFITKAVRRLLLGA